ncbi:glycosyltransferase [Microcoleus sp. MON1_C1]|uniref:glycosyltransferase n=1 Tax=Microcoleus sp. MON1_C1 TaxID=2818827 RepID=UPI002FD484DD
MPKVSVVMASYNHEKYVAETIESVLSQTYQDWEFIITDDGSPDGTVDVMKRFDDARIKLFCFSQNQGACTAMNNCIQEAKGEYIAVINSDDAWMPEKLEKQVKFLDEHPEKGAIFGYAQIIDEEGKKITEENHFYSQVFIQPNRTRFEWLRHFFFNGNCLCHPSILIRKHCYDDIGLYDERFALLPDFDFWIRLCIKYEIFIMPESLVKFRIRLQEANASGNKPETQMRHHLEFSQILKNYISPDTLNIFLDIFPVSARIEGIESRLNIKDIEVELAPFIIAMFAIRHSNPAHRYFCFDILYQMYSQKELAQKLKQKYSFDFSDLIKLAGEQDVFGTVALQQSQSQVHQTEAVLEQTYCHLRSIEVQLEESKAQLQQTEGLLEQSQSQLQQTEGLLEQFQSQLQQAEGLLEQSQAQLYETQEQLEQYETKLHQTEVLLEQSQARIQQSEGLFAQSQAQLYETQEELEQSETKWLHTEGLLEQSQAQLQQTEGLLAQSQAQLYETETVLEQSQEQLHKTEEALEQSQEQLHKTEEALEQSQEQLHKTEEGLEQSQSLLYETQEQLEQSETKLHQTEVVLEQSQAQLHKTEVIMKQFQNALRETQEDLTQSESLLHETQQALEESVFQISEFQREVEVLKSQLHKVNSELNLQKSQSYQFQKELAHSRFLSEAIAREQEGQSKTPYQLLVWDAWYAYQSGEPIKMKECLQESLKCTPFPKSETILNWLESFTKFSLEKEGGIDIQSLTNSAEWKQLVRQAVAVKARG